MKTIRLALLMSLIARGAAAAPPPAAAAAHAPLQAYMFLMVYSDSTVVRLELNTTDVARALSLLASGKLHPRALLSAERPLEELEAALRSMRRREALKVVIRP